MKIKIDLDNGISLHWPTPIFSRKFENTEDMNKRLVEIIHEKEREGQKVEKSIKGGWHSAEDVHTWDFPEIKQFVGFMTEATTELTKMSAGVTDDEFGADTTFVAWANILRNGGFHRNHTHPGSAWSGVYYVQSGMDSIPDEDADEGGFIEFSDPRNAVEMVPIPGNPFGQRLTLPPESGRLYAFPAWL
jgi:uncharacterized protein (TIGR02466 family)